MVARATHEIDFSTFPDSDGAPMAETSANAIQMVDLQFALQSLFAQQGRAHTTTVGGNQFVYYNPANGRDNISPDVYVIFDVPPPAPPKWETWIEGKFPDIVFEISSPSTQREDLSERPGRKRRVYVEQGAKEYYIYDPQGAMDPPFLGFESRHGRMEPLTPLASGGIISPLLEAELRPMPMVETPRRPAGTWLRVIDPTSGRPVRVAEETHDAFLATEDQLTATQQQLAVETRTRIATHELIAVLEGRLATTEKLLTATQEHLTVETQARIATQELLAMTQNIVAEGAQTRIALQKLLALSDGRVAEEAQARLAVEKRLADESRARLAVEERVVRLEALMQAPRPDPTPGQGAQGDQTTSGAE
jgi:Uma2 family endonuclease/flagellar motor switch/type III secretory pathway protein FliN